MEGTSFQAQCCVMSIQASYEKSELLPWGREIMVSRGKNNPSKMRWLFSYLMIVIQIFIEHRQMSHIYHIFLKYCDYLFACKRVFSRAMTGTNMDAGGTPRGVIPEAQRPVRSMYSGSYFLVDLQLPCMVWGLFLHQPSFLKAVYISQQHSLVLPIQLF